MLVPALATTIVTADTLNVAPLTGVGVSAWQSLTLAATVIPTLSG